jgi:hypothetical protein
MNCFDKFHYCVKVQEVGAFKSLLRQLFEK